MADYYNLRELTKKIIEEFKLDIKDEEYIEIEETKSFYSYYQRIRRALKEIGEFNKGVYKKDPVTKRKNMCYSEAQKQMILSEATFHDYVINHSIDEDIKNKKNYKDYQRVLLEYRKEYFNSLSTKNEDEGVPCISDEEFNQYKMKMMITAVFEHFYTSIDDDLFRYDLERINIYMNDAHPEIEDLRAAERLKHPEGYYYRKRSKYKK